MKGYGDPAKTAGMDGSPALARSARAEVRSCAVTVIQDSVHIPHLERADAFTATLNAFLK